jgi:hypothetical protein
MTYVAVLAKKIRDQVPPELLPDGDLDLLFSMYALLGLAKGESVREEDVHNAWVAWMTHQGKAHSALRPYRDLPAETRRQDDPFVEAIRAVMQKADSA